MLKKRTIKSNIGAFSGKINASDSRISENSSLGSRPLYRTTNFGVGSGIRDDRYTFSVSRIFSYTLATYRRKRTGMFSFRVDWCSIKTTSSPLITNEMSLIRSLKSASSRVLISMGVSLGRLVPSRELYSSIKRSVLLKYIVKTESLYLRFAFGIVITSLSVKKQGKRCLSLLFTLGTSPY